MLYISAACTSIEKIRAVTDKLRFLRRAVGVPINDIYYKTAKWCYFCRNNSFVGSYAIGQAAAFRDALCRSVQCFADLDSGADYDLRMCSFLYPRDYSICL